LEDGGTSVDRHCCCVKKDEYHRPPSKVKQTGVAFWY
jgi:hypothetical protein